MSANNYATTRFNEETQINKANVNLMQVAGLSLSECCKETKPHRWSLTARCICPILIFSYSWAFYNLEYPYSRTLEFFTNVSGALISVLRPLSRKKSGHDTALILLIAFTLESLIADIYQAFFYIMHTVQLTQFLIDITSLQDQQLGANAGVSRHVRRLAVNPGEPAL